MINIRIEQEFAAPVRLSLYNALGELVITQSIEAAKELHSVMDLENLASGTYFLRVQSDAIQQVRRVTRR